MQQCAYADSHHNINSVHPESMLTAHCPCLHPGHWAVDKRGHASSLFRLQASQACLSHPLRALTPAAPHSAPVDCLHERPSRCATGWYASPCTTGDSANTACRKACRDTGSVIGKVRARVVLFIKCIFKYTIFTVLLNYYLY